MKIQNIFWSPNPFGRSGDTGVPPPPAWLTEGLPGYDQQQDEPVENAYAPPEPPAPAVPQEYPPYAEPQGPSPYDYPPNSYDQQQDDGDQPYASHPQQNYYQDEYDDVSQDGAGYYADPEATNPQLPGAVHFQQGYHEPSVEAPQDYEQPSPGPADHSFLKNSLDAILEDEAPRGFGLGHVPALSSSRRPLPPPEESMDIEPYDVTPPPPEGPPPPSGDEIQPPPFEGPPPEDEDDFDPGEPGYEQPYQPYYNDPHGDQHQQPAQWEEPAAQAVAPQNFADSDQYAPPPPQQYSDPQYPDYGEKDLGYQAAPPPPPPGRMRLTAPVVDRFADPFGEDSYRNSPPPASPVEYQPASQEPEGEPFDQMQDETSLPPGEAPPPVILTAAQESLSDPGFKQPTVADFIRQKEERSFGSTLPPVQQKSTGSLQEFDEAMNMSPAPQGEPAPSAKERLLASPLYTGTLGNTPSSGSPPVHKGVPIYIPDVTARKEIDPTAGARRMAGVFFAFAAMIILAEFFFHQQHNLGGMLITPLALAGLALLTGARWTRFIGILIGMLYGTAFIAGGLMLIYPELAEARLSPEVAIPPFPPFFHFLLLACGACLLIAPLVMLVGRPRGGRVALGAAIMLLPLIATSGTLFADRMRPRLESPIDDFVSRSHGSNREGFFFEKPFGWARYNWTQVQERTAMGRGLSTEPNYHFVDQEKGLLAAFYLVEPHRLGLSRLLGAQEIHPIEEEIVRGISPTNNRPFIRQENGRTFSRNTYSGTNFYQENLNIIVDSIRVDDKILLVVMIRDAKSRTTQEVADQAMAAYLNSLELTR